MPYFLKEKFFVLFRKFVNKAYPVLDEGVTPIVCKVELPLMIGVATGDRGTAMFATAAAPVGSM